MVDELPDVPAVDLAAEPLRQDIEQQRVSLMGEFLELEEDDRHSPGKYERLGEVHPAAFEEDRVDVGPAE